MVAACLVDEDALRAIQRTGVLPADFHDTRCAYAYGAILDVWERDNSAVYIVGRTVLGAVNQITVAHRMASIPDDSGRQSQLAVVGGGAWLSGLVDELVTSVGAEWSAELVKDCAARRRAVVAAEMLADAARQGDANVAAKGMALFGGLTKRQAPAPVMTLDGCGVCVTGEIVCYGSNEQGYCAEHVPAELRGSVWVA